MLPADFAGIYNAGTSYEKALELLALVEIEEHAYKIPAHISGGQKQRVAIARALINDPPLIIADEPTGNLDSVTAETIFQIFEKLVERGKTIIMVTHDESLANRFSRRLHIVDGALVDPNKKKTGRQGARTKTADDTHKEYVREQNGSGVSKKPKKKNGSNNGGHDHPALILRGVNKTYESPAGKFVALKSIDLQIDYGQFISIVGKSGSGKSTLLNMITGIDNPTHGEVVVRDEYIYEFNESERALWRGKNMGVVFQFFQLLPTLSLIENVVLPMDYCDVYPFSEREERAMDLLRMVGLEEQAHKLPAAVSSGQQQSAAIARALATDPDIILADEPTGNLDSKSAENVLRIFERLAERGKTVLIVTHDPAITRRTDQTIILSDGEIIDQTVARALPFLTHPQMLQATHSAQKKIFNAKETILTAGIPVDHFYMIESGEVEVVLRLDDSPDSTLAVFGPGQFFGEIELTRGTNAVAYVRAAGDGARVSLLPKKEFFRMVDGSTLTRSTIEEIADTRFNENTDRREAGR
jgi:ABC-type lipoprotein export system ATPase subunit